MKSLHTLLKVAQRRLDDLGAEAGRIQAHVNQLSMDLASLKAREQTEVAAASADLTFASMLPAYRLRMKWQSDEVHVKIAESEATLALIRERLSVAYQEKSKFEQLLEQQRIRETMERAALEQGQLDEVAINRAGRAG